MEHYRTYRIIRTGKEMSKTTNSLLMLIFLMLKYGSICIDMICGSAGYIKCFSPSIVEILSALVSQSIYSHK
jgi:hypothetical protein